MKEITEALSSAIYMMRKFAPPGDVDTDRYYTAISKLEALLASLDSDLIIMHASVLAGDIIEANEGKNIQECLIDDTSGTLEWTYPLMDSMEKHYKAETKVNKIFKKIAKETKMNIGSHATP